MEMTSCQVTGIAKNIWVRFRQKCLSEGVSANQKIRRMIEAEAFSGEDGEESNRLQGIKGKKNEKNQ
jgi:hypothetical protein